MIFHRLTAIDPGPKQSAYVMFGVGHHPQRNGIVDNDKLLYGEAMRAERLVIEGISCYGMPVGKDVFDTCIWIGRFIQKFGPCAAEIIDRKDVKLHLCNSARAKDPMVRQALIDRYGGKTNGIGTKKHPGPLYGITSHCWSALAVGVTWMDRNSAKLLLQSGCR